MQLQLEVYRSLGLASTIGYRRDALGRLLLDLFAGGCFVPGDGSESPI